jgi:predicted nucleic acid-binding protein
MYLLGSQEFADLTSRDEGRTIFQWLKATPLGSSDLFVSALSIGMLANTIEDLPPPEREQWRRLLAAARRQFEALGGIIPVDLEIVDAWSAHLRGRELFEEDPAAGYREMLGEDTRLIIATAIARNLTLVTRREPYHDEIINSSTLTIVEP